MTLLFRYMMRQNVFLTLLCLLTGTALFVVTDMFERLDNILEYGLSAGTVLFFFGVRIPMIIALILPAVYLLALVTQLNILSRNRELTALYAGGISPLVLVRFVLLYGLLWGMVQFGMAQGLGVYGERAASRIWQEQVKGTTQDEISIKGLWFTEGNRIVHIAQAFPVLQKGTGVTIYTLDDSGVSIEEVLKAASFTIRNEGGWVLENGSILSPPTYSSSTFEVKELDLEQDLRAFQLSASSSIKANALSLGELSEVLERLERAGSNVEGLRTAWHAKLAYAGSLIVMGLLALIVSRITPNIYKALFLSLIIVFLYYVANTMAVSMGEKGLVAAVAGAWFANTAFTLLGLLWLVWPAVRQRLKGF